MALPERSVKAWPRRIALVDCNNFYASCERVFRPAWRNRPLGVLSNNDGCIVARSNELKAANIPMGAPYFKFKNQLEAMKAIIVSSNYTLYGDMSARVMDTLAQFTPDLEVYSIDEAWLDLTGFDLATLDAYGREIVAITHKHTGIPVSMGIAPTKVLAKLANRICKKRNIPAQVFNMGSADNLDTLLKTIEVGDVWGIGRRWSEKLNSHGIYTALDLRNSDAQYMRDRYNVVMQRIILELRGVPCLEAEDIEPKKQIMASRSFGQRVTALEDLQQAVATHATRAAEKLRAQGSACGVIQVSIRSGRHNPNEQYYGRSAQYNFPVPTSDTAQLIRAATQGVASIYRESVRYAKAGVMLGDICPADIVQSTLFEQGDSDKRLALMQAIDRINSQNGRNTIKFASSGIKQSWLMKQDKKTKAYTTSWSDLPRVN